jgi:hypothetical protein
VPLERRFTLSPLDSQAVIFLPGASTTSGSAAVAALSQHYPKARLIFSGFVATDPEDEMLKKVFTLFGGDPRAFTSSPDHGRLPRTHFTSPHYSNQSPVKVGCWSGVCCTDGLNSRSIGCTYYST